MNESTLLLRQIHPSWVKDGIATSQCFSPTPKDHDLLSVSDGDQISAEAAFRDYTERQNLRSAAVMGVSTGECQTAGVSARPDPLPEQPAHAVIDFSAAQSANARRRIAKELTERAAQRGWLFQAPDPPQA